MEEFPKPHRAAIAKLAKAAEELAAKVRVLAEASAEPDRATFVVPAVSREMQKLMAQLQQAPEAFAEVSVWLQSAIAEAETRQDRARARLTGALSTALEDAGFHVSGHVPELCVGVLTVEVLFESAKARVWFGPKLEELGVCELDPKAVAKLAQEITQALSTDPLDDASFHAQLREAWRVAAAREGAQADAHWQAPLSAIHREMAWIRQSPSLHAQPTRNRFKDYLWHQFAYDLFRWRERTVAGWEVRLNVATRDQTRKRGESLWVPRNARGEGTHFASLAVRRAEEG